MTISFVERCVRYMMKVECRACADLVYPHEDETRATVQYWIDYEGLGDIEGLKARIDHYCDGCNWMLDHDS